MMYVSQIIMLCIFNLYRAVCQLCLNKTGRKNKIEMSCSDCELMSQDGGFWVESIC